MARKCTKCGSSNVAKILYGLVDITPELQKELDEGKTVMGGCNRIGGGAAPRWECHECGHYWPSPLTEP